MSKKLIRLAIKGSFKRAIYFLDWKKGKIEKLPSIRSEFSKHNFHFAAKINE